mgnify:CR=1 FL=1
MKQPGGSDEQKRRAGESAAELVTDGMVVGLGTGSTAAHAIRAIGRAVDAGLDVRGVPTSYQSRQLAIDEEIPLVSLDEIAGDGADGTPAGGIDLAIDGADQVLQGTSPAQDGALVKGGGAAHAREKIVDAAAGRFVVVADPSKLANALDVQVPVEVLPDARTTVADAIRDLDGTPDLRAADRKDGPVVTDNGNLVLDCDFGPIPAPGELAAALAAIPGVVEHGLFVDLADELHVGLDDGVEVTRYA